MSKRRCTETTVPSAFSACLQVFIHRSKRPGMAALERVWCDEHQPLRTKARAARGQLFGVGEVTFNIVCC